MKRINRRLSVHTSSLTQHHELKKHSALPKVKNNKEAIAKHFNVIDIDDENDDFSSTLDTLFSSNDEENTIIDLMEGIDTSEIQHDLKTIPEIRSSHSVRKILQAVSKLTFFDKLRSKETAQRIISKGIYLRLPENSMVYSQDDKEDGIYIILSGGVKVLEKLPESDSSDDDDNDNNNNNNNNTSSNAKDNSNKHNINKSEFNLNNTKTINDNSNINRPHTTKASRNKSPSSFNQTNSPGTSKKKKKKKKKKKRKKSPKQNNRNASTVIRRASLSPTSSLSLQQQLFNSPLSLSSKGSSPPSGGSGGKSQNNSIKSKKALGRRRSIHHMVGTGGIGRGSRNNSPLNFYHDTLDLNRELDHDDDGYKYIKQYGPGTIFGLKEKLNIRVNNLRKYSIKISVDGTELLYLDHNTYVSIMDGKNKDFVYNVKLQANKIVKNEKGKNKSVLMVLDSMFEDNSFFKNIKNNTADLRHRCIEKLNIVYMGKGKTIVQAHQKSMFAYVCLSGIAKSIGIDTNESNLDKKWIYPGDVLGLEELLNEETIKQKFIAHDDILFGMISRNDYYILFENLKSRKQKELRDWLRQIMPGLENFTTIQLNSLLTLFKKTQIRKGEIIVAENDRNEYIYFIRQGSVIVRKELIGDVLPKKQVKISSLIAGSFFGVVACVTNTPHQSMYISESNTTILMKISISDFNKKFPRADIRYLLNLETKTIKEQERRYDHFQNIQSYECDRNYNIKQSQSLGEFKDVSSNPAHVHKSYEPIEKKIKVAKNLERGLYQHKPSFYSPLKVKAPNRAPTFSSTSEFETYNPYFRPNGKRRAKEGQLENNRLEDRLKQINKTSGPKPIDLRNEKSILTTDYLRQVIDLSEVVPPNWLNKHSGTMWRDSGLGKPKKLPRVIWNDDDKVRLYYADTKTYKTEAKKRKEHIRAFGNINPDVTHQIRQRIEDTIRPGYLKWIDP